MSHFHVSKDINTFFMSFVPHGKTEYIYIRELKIQYTCTYKLLNRMQIHWYEQCEGTLVAKYPTISGGSPTIPVIFTIDNRDVTSVSMLLLALEKVQ